MQQDFVLTPLIALRLCVFDQTSWETGWLFMDVCSVEALSNSFNLVGCLCSDLPVLLTLLNRTVYIHGFTKTDFTLWHSAITLAAGTDGKALSDQQLTKNGVPIIVDSCIAFVTQYGELH